MSTLQCIGCSKELPLARFSKTQRKELEPECQVCIEWRLINPGDAIPTPPPGGDHALRDFEKHGSVARLMTAPTAQTSVGEHDDDNMSLISGHPTISRNSATSYSSPDSRFSNNLPAPSVRAKQAPGSSRAPSIWSSRPAASNSGSPSTPNFDKNAYSSVSGGSSGGSCSAASKSNNRKWPKGDNRKQFNVLPEWQ